MVSDTMRAESSPTNPREHASAPDTVSPAEKLGMDAVARIIGADADSLAHYLSTTEGLNETQRERLACLSRAVLTIGNVSGERKVIDVLEQTKPDQLDSIASHILSDHYALAQLRAAGARQELKHDSSRQV